MSGQKTKTLIGVVADVELCHVRGNDGFLLWWFEAKKGNSKYQFDIRGILEKLSRPTVFVSSGMRDARANGTVLDFIQITVNELGLNAFWDWICEDGGARYHHGMSRPDWEAKLARQEHSEKGD